MNRAAGVRRDRAVCCPRPRAACHRRVERERRMAVGQRGALLALTPPLQAPLPGARVTRGFPSRRSRCLLPRADSASRGRSSPDPRRCGCPARRPRSCRRRAPRRAGAPKPGDRGERVSIGVPALTVLPAAERFTGDRVAADHTRVARRKRRRCCPATPPPAAVGASSARSRMLGARAAGADLLLRFPVQAAVGAVAQEICGLCGSSPARPSCHATQTSSPLAAMRGIARETRGRREIDRVAQRASGTAAIKHTAGAVAAHFRDRVHHAVGFRDVGETGKGVVAAARRTARAAPSRRRGRRADPGSSGAALRAGGDEDRRGDRAQLVGRGPGRARRPDRRRGSCCSRSHPVRRGRATRRDTSPARGRR